MQTKRSLLLITIILLVGAGLRISGIVYALNQICLTPTEERWLYNPEQVSSLYTWNYDPNEFAQLELSLEPGTRAFFAGRKDLLWGRFAGVLASMVTIAVTLNIGKRLRSNLWWLTGAAVAVLPWFVNSDRWVSQFDLATLLVALNGWCLLYLYTKRSIPRYSIITWLHPLTAILLLLVAPPLWWLAALLLALPAKPQWSKLLFFILGALVVFPTLRNPLEWWKGATAWDSSITSACIWTIIMMGVWRWRNLAIQIRSVLAASVAVLGVYSAVTVAQLPRPDQSEWDLVYYLQDHIPDQAVVYFDSNTWPLHSVIACPLDIDIHYDAHPLPIDVPINPDPRVQPAPDLVVAVDRASVPDTSYNQQVANHYWVGRTNYLVNPEDKLVGSQFRLLDHEIVTPVIVSGDQIDIRLSTQYTSQVDVNILGYSLFIHVTEPGNPGEKLINFNRGLVDSLGDPNERRIEGNYHLYIDTPSDAPPGTYDVIFGVFDNTAGQLVDMITLGQITIVEQSP